MAEENIPAPTRFDDQLVPVKAHLPYGKSNLLLDLQKLQKNPIFRISVDILQNTNFFRAFTASKSVPSIYTAVLEYSDIGSKALKITPIDAAYPFVSPLAGEQVMDFVNELGYPEEIHFVSKMHVNNLYQPWRAILTLINQCLTDKTSGELLWEEFVQRIQTFFSHRASLSIPSKKSTPHVIPYCWFTKLIIYYLGSRHNILCRIVTRTNVDYSELLWEKFVQGIQTFFSHRASLSIPSKKSTPHVIPYCRFTKLIIYYLGSRHNIHKRPESPIHVRGNDFLLGNLKFVPKGEKDEVFGMPIPKDVKKKTVSLADKSKKHAPAKQTKHVKEKTTKPPPKKKIHKGKVAKVRKAHGQVPVGGMDIREPVAETTRQLHVVEVKGKDIATDEQAAQSLLDLHKPKKKSVTDQYIFLRRNPVTKKVSTGPSAAPYNDTSANIVCDTPSLADAETDADSEKTNIEGEDMSNKVDLEEKTTELDEGHAGSDPGKTPESRPPPERILMEEDQTGPNPRQSHVALVGLNPDPMHDDFVAIVYLKFYESLKHTTEKHVHLDNPLSSSRTLSSVKNLDLRPSLSTPIIDLTPPKPVSSILQEPVFTATPVTIRTTLLPPPPLEQQSSTNPELANRVSTLEKIIMTCTLRLTNKLAPILERFKELSEVQMKEILHDQMFKSGSYKSHPEHKAFYKDLEAFVDRDNREEFLKTISKSRKRHRDDQNPPPPPPKDTDQNDVHTSNSKDTGAAHISKIKTRPDLLKPVPKEERPKTHELEWAVPPNDHPEPKNN
nr:hypothetical protein [Tanacetum cinerariifolium]